METVNQAAHRRFVRRNPLYATWRGMLQRCENPAARGYEYYGGQGIKVYPRWHNYKSFERWIFRNIGRRPAGCTLDRIDNWGDYEPGNVRWATASEQRRNRRPAWTSWPENRERRWLYE